MFARVKIYAKGPTCFDKIQNSKKPTIVINTDLIVSIGEPETWGFCEGNEDYPFRIINMVDGSYYYCVLESADALEALLLR